MQAEPPRPPSGKPDYEKPENRARSTSTSTAPPPSQLRATIAQLEKPVEAGTDPAQVQQQLEEGRQRILREAEKLANLRQDVDIMVREYNTANGIKPRWLRAKLEQVHPSSFTQLGAGPLGKLPR